MDQRRQEFEATALPFARSLYGTALRLTGRADDAADLVQETFLRAYRTFDSFRIGTNAKAWLFTILRSVLANRYKRMRRAPPTVPFDEIEERFGRVAPSVTSPLEEPGVEEVGRALGSLAEEFRLAVLLVDVEGLTYEEAARALGCPVGTIRSRLARGRRALFIELRGYARGAGYPDRSS